MVYGPYQSKLLRLVLGQYRKGLDRHRRAVRQTRSTVVTGAVLGGTWALVPLQAAVRWSQQWARQLKRITTSERSQRLGSSEVECEATDDSGAISQVLSVLDDTFLASTLSTQKISGLAGGIKALLLHRFAWLRRNRDAQITGFASDLETRSLLLVIDYTSVWGGLSGDQQQKLEREIAKRLAGTAVCAVEGPANGLDLSISSGLAKPVRSMGLASRSSSGWALPSPSLATLPAALAKSGRLVLPAAPNSIFQGRLIVSPETTRLEDGTAGFVTTDFVVPDFVVPDLTERRVPCEPATPTPAAPLAAPLAARLLAKVRSLAADGVLAGRFSPTSSA